MTGCGGVKRRAGRGRVIGQDIPPELYEAAAIDGATGWRRFWSITLPLLRPVLLFVLVTHVIGSFQILRLSAS